MDHFNNYRSHELITINEVYNRDKLRLIINHFDEPEIHNQVKMKDLSKGYTEITDINTKKTILSKSLKNKIIKYIPSNSSPDGRKFGKLSLQGMPKVIRHTVCSEIWHDYDIVNCHPTLLRHYCNCMNIKCDILDDYIENRDKYIKDILDEKPSLERDDVKNIYLSILNGGFQTGIHFYRSILLEQFFNQIQEIHQAIIKLEPERYEKARKKKQYNVEGTCINSLLCFMENKILDCWYDYCVENKIQVGGLMFDGLLSKFLNTEEVEKYIYDKLKISLKIVEKPMDKGIDLSKYEITEFLDIPTSDEDLAKFFYETYKDNIKHSLLRKQIYLYDESKKLWIKSSYEKLTTKFTEICIPYLKDVKNTTTDLEIHKKIDNCIEDLKSFKKQNAIFRILKNLLDDDDKFIDKYFDKIPYLFPFQDKVIDFRTTEVLNREKEHYFTKTTNNVFKPDRPNRDYVINLIKDFLMTDDELYIKNFLQWFGYCLTNENNVKAFVILTGLSDSGKSTFLNMIKKIMGNDFHHPADDKIFLRSNINQSHSDELASLLDARFSTLNEIQSGANFNEKLIKSITGNDGFIPLRRCGGQSFKAEINCKITIVYNDVDAPSFTDTNAFGGRMKVIYFPNAFKKDTNKYNEILSHTDDLFTELCYINAEYYQNNEIIWCQQIIDKSKEIIRENDNLKEFIENGYDITNKEIHRIGTSELFSDYKMWCDRNGLYPVGRTGFHKIMKNDYKLKVIRSRTYTGIKKVEQNYDYENKSLLDIL